MRRLRLPWRALLERLGALPLRSCRWRDERGAEHLLLLLGARGHLLHLSTAGGAALTMRACSMHKLTHKHELLSDLAESVATAISVWVWEQTMAMLQKGGGASGQMAAKMAGWQPRAHY